MRYLLLIAPLFLFISCVEKKTDNSAANNLTPNGFIRVNSTLQEYNEVQPWDLKPPTNRRGLGTLLANNQIITTSEMVANAAYIELESADGVEKFPAKVVAMDRGANLALLEPVEHSEDSFLTQLTPLELSPALKINDQVEAWQLEGNGQKTVTKTNIYAVDVVPTHNSGKHFFSYLLKGSLQSAANSYTVPILSGGKLAGVLTSYDSEEQISEVVTSTILEQFLNDAADGEYDGFPSLGIAGSRMPDQASRDWVGLSEGEGGLYITQIAENSAASEAGLKVGDVLLAFDGHELDRKGYYDDKQYGKISWTHLIRGSKSVGDPIAIKIKRDGEILEKSATLKKESKKLIPREFSAEGPQYLVKGGVIFQQLTKKYLQAYGNEWPSRAPLNLLDIYYNPNDYEEQFKEAVIITGVIPSQNTVGYEQIRNTLVTKVNGVDIKVMSDLQAGFDALKEAEIHHLELSEPPYNIYLDAKACDEVDAALLKQGLPALQRIHR